MSGNCPKAATMVGLLWVVAGVLLYGCKCVLSGCQGVAVHLPGCSGGF